METRHKPQSIPTPGGSQKHGGAREGYDEERVELESDPSPDEDDIGDDDDASDAAPPGP